MQIVTCHIGCISPRRQAPKRRTLQTPTTCFVMLVLSSVSQVMSENIGLMFHTDFVNPVVSACVQNIGLTRKSQFQTRFNSTVGGLDLWFTHMLTVGGRDLWFTHALNFVVKWTLEGTNATHNLPYRLHKSATPSPKATYTPNFQNPFRHACPVTVKNIGLKTIGQILEIYIVV